MIKFSSFTFRSVKFRIVLAVLATEFLVACSDGGLTVDSSGADPTSNCDGSCALAVLNQDDARLTVDDVGQVLSQGVAEARARGVDATIAVVDRVGNILGVYRMGDRRDRHVVISTEFTDADGIIDDASDQTFAIDAGLEGIKLPLAITDSETGDRSGILLDANLDHLAAVSKAITGAYLSSEGNAFTSRTANQIVQEHFNPGEDFQPGGPLFGVQFSQLGCGDFTPLPFAVPGRFPEVTQSNRVFPGPHPSPLGLSADAGGLPLYKNGTVVGGVGVMADSIYGIDKTISDVDSDLDELIAVASTFGYGAPIDRRDRVTVEGKVFRYSDADFGNLISDPANAPAFSTVLDDDSLGSLVAVRFFSPPTLRSGTVFGQPESGIRPDEEGLYPGLDAFVFVDENNNPRFSPRAGLEPASFLGTDPMTETEVRTLLANALSVANRARAQIRRPLGVPARVTISVVDTQGNILGMVRGRDAPTFGADVSLQKARTAAFFSSKDGGDYFRNPTLEAPRGNTQINDSAVGPEGQFPSYVYLKPPVAPGVPGLESNSLLDYLDQLGNFLELPGFPATAENPEPPVLDGTFAFSDRAGGNLSRPFFPDGINDTEAGPLSKPFGEWSVFSTGMQLDLAINGILTGVVAASFNTDDGVTYNPTPPSDGSQPDLASLQELVTPAAGQPVGCVGRSFELLGLPGARQVQDTRTLDGQQVPAPRLANGIQIFPGSVPVYRGNTLVGGIGVSGDGIDQDDMISFFGLHQASIALNGSIGNAPREIRADQLTPRGVRLRYVQCPQAPFIGSDEQNVCEGL